MTSIKEINPSPDSHLVIFLTTVLQSNGEEIVDRWFRAMKGDIVDKLHLFMRTLLFVPLKLKFSDNGKTLWLFSEIVTDFKIVYADAEKANMAKTMLKLSKQSFSDHYLSQVSLYVDMQPIVENTLKGIMFLSNVDMRFSIFHSIKAVITSLQEEFRHAKMLKIESFLHKAFIAATDQDANAI